MSLYLNIGNEGFASARNGEYVDKSGLIAVMNSTLHTERRFSCVTRCRRFGKSMAAKMLSAYYDCSCDSRHLFHDLEIARHPSFEKYLNKYPVIYLDMSVINNKNDALTVLIHLGYLAYEWETSECYSPNREVEGELINLSIEETCL